MLVSELMDELSRMPPGMSVRLQLKGWDEVVAEGQEFPITVFNGITDSPDGYPYVLLGSHAYYEDYDDDGCY